MAKPELSNGYVKIANELEEAFCKLKVSGEEWQVIRAVIRMTYGFHKKTADIKPKKIRELTGIMPSSVSRAKASLVERFVLFVDEDGKIGIQKDYTRWIGKNRASRKPNEEQPTVLPKPKPAPAKKKKKEPVRHRYGEFKNVLLSDEEHAHLVEKYGEARVRTLIEEVGLYEKTNKRGYKDFQGAVITFARNEDKKGSANPNKPRPANNYTRLEDVK